MHVGAAEVATSWQRRFDSCYDRFVSRASVTIAILLTLALAACGSERGAQSSAEPSADAVRQACVERWNWMHYVGDFVELPNRSVPVTVRINPCRIEIDYRLPDAPHIKSLYFPCGLNQFQAYVCTEHALGLPAGPPRTGQNGRYFSATGRIHLDRAPQHPVTAPRPAWIKRYPVTHGFIEPFDSHGQLRLGLTWRKPLTQPYSCGTFPKIAQTTLIGCGAGLYCFVPRLPVSNRELIACPATRGSRTFFRARLYVPPSS